MFPGQASSSPASERYSSTGLLPSPKADKLSDHKSWCGRCKLLRGRRLRPTSSLPETCRHRAPHPPGLLLPLLLLPGDKLHDTDVMPRKHRSAPSHLSSPCRPLPPPPVSRSQPEAATTQSSMPAQPPRTNVGSSAPQAPPHSHHQTQSQPQLPNVRPMLPCLPNASLHALTLCTALGSLCVDCGHPGMPCHAMHRQASL